VGRLRQRHQPGDERRRRAAGLAGVVPVAASRRLVLAYPNPGARSRGWRLRCPVPQGAFHETRRARSGVQLGAADFRARLAPVLQSAPDFNTLGASPAQTIAARGPSGRRDRAAAGKRLAR
jgi:hypothetical protein